MSARELFSLAASLLLLSCARTAPADDPQPNPEAASADVAAIDAASPEAASPGASEVVDPLEARWRELAAEVDATSLTERFLQASAVFLGATYHNGPLGEAEYGGPDPDPRVDFDRADCVTYLEQSLALALGPPPASPSAGGRKTTYLDLLDRIRYRDGKVGFAERNHFMSIDWLSANAWLVKDVTAQVAPGIAVDVTRTIDRAKFLREKGVTPRPGVDGVRKVTMAIIPRKSAAAVAAAIQAGDLIFWAGKSDGILFVHTGLAARDRDGTLLFRHASSKFGAVVEQPLAEYADGAGFTFGFAVLRLKPDAAVAMNAAVRADPGTAP